MQSKSHGGGGGKPISEKQVALIFHRLRSRGYDPRETLPDILQDFEVDSVEELAASDVDDVLDAVAKLDNVANDGPVKKITFTARSLFERDRCFRARNTAFCGFNGWEHAAAVWLAMARNVSEAEYNAVPLADLMRQLDTDNSIPRAFVDAVHHHQAAADVESLVGST